MKKLAPAFAAASTLAVLAVAALPAASAFAADGSDNPPQSRVVTLEIGTLKAAVDLGVNVAANLGGLGNVKVTLF